MAKGSFSNNSRDLTLVMRTPQPCQLFFNRAPVISHGGQEIQEENHYCVPSAVSSTRLWGAELLLTTKFQESQVSTGTVYRQTSIVMLMQIGI